jgi:hypothetical protein
MKYICCISVVDFPRISRISIFGVFSIYELNRNINIVNNPHWNLHPNPNLLIRLHAHISRKGPIFGLSGSKAIFLGSRTNKFNENILINHNFLIQWIWLSVTYTLVTCTIHLCMMMWTSGLSRLRLGPGTGMKSFSYNVFTG